jgi:hypothetical protein
MATFAEFMAESYRSNVPLIWNLSGQTKVTAAFALGRVKVIVSFEQRETEGAWHVSFDVEKGENIEVAHSAFAIFNGVFQAVEEFIEVRQPEMLVFATKREELAAIYQTYLRRESATIESLGYSLQGPQRVDPYTEFTLRRVQPSQWKKFDG